MRELLLRLGCREEDIALNAAGLPGKPDIVLAKVCKSGV